MTLVTVADFLALPGVNGVEEGLARITIYRDAGLSMAAFARLQGHVDDRAAVNLLVAWKTDRRKAERRRRAAGSTELPPIPTDARWQ